MNHTFITGSLCFCFFLFSCLVYRKAEKLKSKEEYITALPLQPHNNEVEIFLTDQPSKPYYEVKFIEVTASPKTKGEEVMKMLKSAAQKQGLDAVLAQDMGRQLSNINTMESANGTVSYIKVTGIGIKYKDQLTYINSILKEQEVELWTDENQPPKNFFMKFDLFGNPLSFSDSLVRNFFNRNVYPFESHQTAYGVIPKWQYHFDTVNRIFAKRFAENVWIEIKAQFIFKDDKVIKCTITEYGAFEKVQSKFNLEFYYNEQGVLIKRTLKDRENRQIIWEDLFTYYFSGRLMKTVRSINRNGVFQPYFEIRNIYFSDGDLPPAKF